MAEQWWTDDDDDDDGGTPPKRGELPEPARQHLRKLEKELKLLREENGTLKKTQHKASVSDLIKAKGFDPDIAKFVPTDVPASEEAVTKWLETEGKFFAKPTTGETTDSDADNTGDSNGDGFAVPPELMEALGLVSNASSGTLTPTKPADAMSKIRNASNPAELLEFLKSQGATV